MKKILIGLLVGALAFSVLVGCGGNIDGEQKDSVSIFKGVIGEITGDTATVTPNDDQQHILSSGDSVSVNLSVSDVKFSVGDEIVVYYTGEIMESYPLQVNVVDIELSSSFDDTSAETSDSSDIAGEQLLPTAKIAINIEGIVTEINGNKITLDNGKVVVITEETAFETQNVAERVPVDDEILIGNFIQGFTLDDLNSAEVTALVINSNGVLEMPMGSVIVNIEGVITEVSEDGNSFLLDTGKWVVVTDETELGITGPTAAPKEEQFFEETFRVGNSIAGFTEDENADELLAYAIYTNWNWEDPVG